MNGLDDLLIILTFIIGGSDAPQPVKDAIARLKKRQADHQPFDEQLPEIG